MNRENQNDISLMVMLFCIILALLSSACGTDVRVKGGTTHEAYAEVSGKVEQVITLKIDVSGCATLAGQDQAQCIKDTVAALGDLVELVKSLSCKSQECLGE